MHFGPSRVTRNKGCEPQFWDTVYICKVNAARKVKSDAQVSMNKNSRPRVEIFLRGGWGTVSAISNFFKLLELSETSRARKCIFGLQVNIDKANSRRYDVTR